MASKIYDRIKGTIDLSLVDWDGKVSSVIFLSGCNFRCPYCYNSSLVLHPEREETISFERYENYLKKRKEWIDGVCITGGEPTLQKDLPDLCLKLNESGFRVKVDTNGTNPIMVKALIERGIIDYIAMDIKAPLTIKKYSNAIGVNARHHLLKVKETIKTLLKTKIDYEFRTTVVPTIHEPLDISEICQVIRGCKKYVMQRFVAEKETINPDFSKLNSFTDKEMEIFLSAARKYIPNSRLR